MPACSVPLVPTFDYNHDIYGSCASIDQKKKKQDAVTAANTQLLNSTSSGLSDGELRSFDMKSPVVTHGTVSLEEHMLTASDGTQKDGAHKCVKV